MLNRVATRAARRWIRRLAYGLIAGSAAISRLFRRYPPPPRSIDRVLVIRLDLLGDVLHSLRAVDALHAAYPSAAITMLTLPQTAPLARLHPLVHDVVEVDTNLIRTLPGLLDPGTWRAYGHVYRLLGSRHYDLAVSVYGRMGSLCACLSRAPWTVGYAAEAYPFLLTDPVPGGRHRERIHEVDYVERLAAHAGGVVPAPRSRLTVPDGADERAAELLADAGVEPGKKIVVVHAGSSNGSAKRWPAANWSRFGDELYHRTGARVVLIGAKGDAALAEQVLKRTRAPVVSLAGKTTIDQLVALLGHADLVASADSGPLHIAVALGRPVLAVYGPTDPLIYGPETAGGRVELHRADLPCSPCYTLAATAECPLGDPICMRLVTVPEMVRGAERLLDVKPDS